MITARRGRTPQRANAGAGRAGPPTFPARSDVLRQAATLHDALADYHGSDPDEAKVAVHIDEMKAASAALDEAMAHPMASRPNVRNKPADAARVEHHRARRLADAAAGAVDPEGYIKHGLVSAQLNAIAEGSDPTDAARRFLRGAVMHAHSGIAVAARSHPDVARLGVSTEEMSGKKK